MARFFPCLPLLLILHHAEGAWKSTLFVSTSGKDTQTCGGRNEPCLSLDYAHDLHLSSGFNSTLLSLGTGSYNLRKILTFKSVENFSIFGEQEEGRVSGTSRAEITCATEAGFAFYLSHNITLRRLKLFKCGAWQDDAALLPNATVLKYKTAVTFDYCRNVRIQDVEISGSIGRAANLHEVGGSLEITNCRFENNSANTQFLGVRQNAQQDRVISLVSGGGVAISLNNYTRFRPGFMNVTPSEHEKYIHGNNYSFTNCSFLGNQLFNGSAVPLDDFKATATFNHSLFWGGALGIFFFGNASNSTVFITNCTFSDNKAQRGGGLQAEFADYTSRNFLKVENSLFERNYGYLAGGGARVGAMLARGASLPMNEVLFVKTNFRNNFAKWGGGVSLYGTSVFCNCRHGFNSDSIFNFHSCRWIENMATVGAAVGAFLFNQNDDFIGPEVPFHAEFRQCEVKHNHVVTEMPNVRIGEGTIYSLGVSIVFRGRSLIAYNNLTALVLDGATAEIHDDLEFVNNTGFRGGAVAMYGYSKIALMKKSTVLFKHNSCKDKGGAFFIQAPGSPQISYNATGMDTGSCFFAYENSSSLGNFGEWQTQITFQDNQAPDDSSGHSVFATTLKNCRMAGESRTNNSVLHWKFIKYITTAGVNATDGTPLNHRRSEIATEPIDISYVANDWKVSPNQFFSPMVKLVDEQGNPVSGVVNVLISATTGSNASAVHLRTPSSLFLAPSDGNVTGLELGGEVGRNFSVVLQHIGRQVLQRVISVHSGLKHCNPAFQLRNGSCVCHVEFEGVSRCDKDGKTVYLKVGYWAGVVKNTFTTYLCPRGFCNCPKHQGWPTAKDECVFIADEMCAGNRDPSSILCGKCKPGFSAVLAKSGCFKCSISSSLIWVSIWLAVTFGVVMLIMIFDVDAFSGSLNACLYSYQVMFPVVGKHFTFGDPVMLFILNFFNLHLYVGRPVCYWPHMDDADKLFLSLCSAVIPLVMAIVLSKLAIKYPNCCISRRVKAPFRAMCTITVFCYTGITSECLLLLHPAVIGGKTVLYLSGETEFFGGKHAVYGGIALLFVVFFVLLFPLVLIFRPYVTRCLQPVFNVNRVKPIFDVLQSPFKDQHRSFAAFYFVSRLVVLMVATYVPSGPIKRSLLETACIAILFIFTRARPYKRSRDVKEGEPSFDWFNKADAFLLLNLCGMAVLSTAIDNDKVLALAAVVQILAYAPLLVLVMSVYRKTKERYWKECCDYNGDGELPPISDTVTNMVASGKVENRLSDSFD